jgi:hypothetical protein
MLRLHNQFVESGILTTPWSEGSNTETNNINLTLNQACHTYCIDIVPSLNESTQSSNIEFETHLTLVDVTTIEAMEAVASLCQPII